MVEQQHDQALYRGEALVAVGTCELGARLGGEQPALAVVDHRWGLARVGSVAMHGTSCPVRISMPARRSIPSREISRRAFGASSSASSSMRSMLPLGRRLGDGGDVEQCGPGQQGRVGCLQILLPFAVRLV